MVNLPALPARRAAGRTVAGTCGVALPYLLQSFASNMRHRPLAFLSMMKVTVVNPGPGRA